MGNTRSDGAEGCGKTQLSHTMSVVAQVPWNPSDMGGANGKVAYIGTAYYTSNPDDILLKLPLNQTPRVLSDPRGTSLLIYRLEPRILLTITE